MFNRNGHKDDKKKPASSVEDWREFDQDLELYPADETSYDVSASPADSSIPSFGVAKSGEKFNRAVARSAVQLPEVGQNGKKKLVGDNSDKKKPSKPKRVPTKQDNRWRFFFGLGLFVVGLAGSILLVQSSSKGIEVIVATRDIAPGQLITGADLTTARMSVPPDFATLLVGVREINTLTSNSEGGKSMTKVAARKLRVHQPIMQGDVVSATTLNKTGVPEGMVAMALPASAATSVSRITPGDMVSLLHVNTKSGPADSSGRPELLPTSKTGLETTLLVEKVVVLDVARSSSGVGLGSANSGSNATGDNQTLSNNRGAITNLTLLLTTEQAQKLATAKETGTINIVLLPFQVEPEKAVNHSTPAEAGANTPALTTSPVPITTAQPTTATPKN